MVPLKRIILASLVAPAAIAGPMFVLAALSWAFMNPISDGDAPFRMAGLGMLAALPLYLVVALLCVAVSSGLQRFGALSRRSLLFVSASVALAIAGWSALRWVQAGNSSQAVHSFLFFFGVCFITSAILSFAWWWLASNPSIERTAKGLRPSSAAHVER